MEIDTGSDRTLMFISLANRLGIEVKYFLKPKLIVGVGGKKIKCEKYGIVKMRVKMVSREARSQLQARGQYLIKTEPESEDQLG